MKKQLTLIKTGKMIGGVATGLADYFEIDVTLVRVLLIAAIIAPVPAVFPYLILWAVMPVRNEQYQMSI